MPRDDGIGDDRFVADAGVVHLRAEYQAEQIADLIGRGRRRRIRAGRRSVGGGCHGGRRSLRNAEAAQELAISTTGCSLAPKSNGRFFHGAKDTPLQVANASANLMARGRRA